MEKLFIESNPHVLFILLTQCNKILRQNGMEVKTVK